ncbi:hypothetical protein A1Q2_02522 [Trichosporon asahii var. asahii CBS 8904]|uniref:Uncharacterized protein n=1 Tax=Trichosporon asahii var. asahii (strain CBS 8904) TaxID=1220162 RepID=K1W2C7_TRIAC|nr:hypothetical protein A1Q2_02522 [Trichosporon asahii var. asahii CBS 8904]
MERECLGTKSQHRREPGGSEQQHQSRSRDPSLAWSIRRRRTRRPRARTGTAAHRAAAHADTAVAALVVRILRVVAHDPRVLRYAGVERRLLVIVGHQAVYCRPVVPSAAQGTPLVRSALDLLTACRRVVPLLAEPNRPAGDGLDGATPAQLDGSVVLHVCQEVFQRPASRLDRKCTAADRTRALVPVVLILTRVLEATVGPRLGVGNTNGGGAAAPPRRPVARATDNVVGAEAAIVEVDRAFGRAAVWCVGRRHGHRRIDDEASVVVGGVGPGTAGDFDGDRHGARDVVVRLNAAQPLIYIPTSRGTDKIRRDLMPTVANSG